MPHKQPKSIQPFNHKMQSNITDPEMLFYLAKTQMPFGKYKGLTLIDLPEPYVIWFSNKGFPEGKLGEVLKLLYEIKVNGLEYLFDPLRKKNYNN